MNKVSTGGSLKRGLDAVFSACSEEKNIEFETATLILNIGQISPSKFQARKKFPREQLEELSNSIRESGILSPLLVRKLGDTYELIAGERRYRAAQLAGLKQVPVVELQVSEEEAIAYGLIENIQREDLNAIEEAEGLQRLVTEFRISHESIARRVGKSRSYVTNMLRLNKLHSNVKQYLLHGEVNMGHARALLTLPSEQQARVCEYVIENNLTVRQTENHVANQLKPDKPTTDLFLVSEELKGKLDIWNQRLQQKWQAKAKLSLDRKGRCKLTISSDNAVEMEDIIKKLAL